MIENEFSHLHVQAKRCKTVASILAFIVAHFYDVPNYSIQEIVVNCFIILRTISVLFAHVIFQIQWARLYCNNNGNNLNSNGVRQTVFAV